MFGISIPNGPQETFSQALDHELKGSFPFNRQKATRRRGGTFAINVFLFVKVTTRLSQQVSQTTHHGCRGTFIIRYHLQGADTSFISTTTNTTTTTMFKLFGIGNRWQCDLLVYDNKGQEHGKPRLKHRLEELHDGFPAVVFTIQ